MTSGGLTREDALRLQQQVRPLPPGPIKHPAAIELLLDMAGMFMDDVHQNTHFTLDQILAEARTVLDKEHTLEEADARVMIDSMKQFEKVDGGYRWK